MHCASSIVGVLATADDRRLVAITPIAAGTHLFSITGRETPLPTRFSLQVGASLHLDQDCAHDEADVVHRYFWRYMNHSCDPTTVIQDRHVIAVRDLAAGDGVTFDYNTTELEMAAPFACHCGSAQCVGTVRGARHLTEAQHARIAAHLSPWIVAATNARADASSGLARSA